MGGGPRQGVVSTWADCSFSGIPLGLCGPPQQHVHLLLETQPRPTPAAVAGGPGSWAWIIARMFLSQASSSRGLDQLCRCHSGPTPVCRARACLSQGLQGVLHTQGSGLCPASFLPGMVRQHFRAQLCPCGEESRVSVQRVDVLGLAPLGPCAGGSHLQLLSRQAGLVGVLWAFPWRSSLCPVGTLVLSRIPDCENSGLWLRL